MSVTAVQQLQFSNMVKRSRRIPRLVDNEIVFAAIPHIAEAAVVQPDQPLTRVRLGDYRIRAVIALDNETATWRRNLLGYSGRRILFKSSLYLGS